MKFELNFFARVLQHLNLNITRQGQIQGFLVNLRFFQRGWDCSHNLQDHTGCSSEGLIMVF